MKQVERGAKGPLALHNEQFSPQGLLLRYARSRVATLFPRLAFSVVVTSLLLIWFDPLVPLALFLIYLISDLVETAFLRALPERLGGGLSLRKAFHLSTVHAAVNALSVLAAACYPLLLKFAGQLNQADHFPLPAAFYAISLVLGPTLLSIFDLRFHRVANAVRVGILSLTPIVVVLAEHYCCIVMPTRYDASVGLMTVASVSFFVALAWTGIYIQKRQVRSRRAMRAQALQRQALADAYMRLYDQKQEARRLALIAENANDSVMLLDSNNRIQWANEAFTRTTGFSFEEAVGKNPCDLLGVHTPAREDQSEIELGRKRAEAFRMELRSRRKDGSLIWLDTNQVPVFDEQGALEAYIAVERDITAAKKYAAELEKARLAAEEGARVKGDFLATMSHEFRTPMNGVIGMAQLLQNTDLNDEQRLYIDTIQSSSQALLELINDVLDISKIDANGVSLSARDFVFRTCVEDAIRLLRPQATDKGLSLDLKIEDTVPALLNGDDRRLRQIIVNLVGNAIKFTDTGGVSVKISAERVDIAPKLTLRVKDTGIGIAAEKLELIFDRFSQADAAINRKYGGTGLGLPICRHIAQAMGGDVTVCSELGEGTEFTVELRFDLADCTDVVQSPEDPAFDLVAKNDLAQIPTPHEPSPSEVDRLAGLKVLIAEDNRVNRLIISRFLRDIPVELIFVEDGVDAVTVSQNEKPDVILMDLSMPRKNGLDASREIRAMSSPQPFIAALTANVDEQSQKACREAGMDAFLTKPLARVKLIKILLQVADARLPSMQAQG